MSESPWNRLYAEIAFRKQIEGDAKRTILCEPHRVDDIRAAVEQRGLADTITVAASPVCPEGQLIVIDTAAMEASWREQIQRLPKTIRNL